MNRFALRSFVAAFAVSSVCLFGSASVLAQDTAPAASTNAPSGMPQHAPADPQKMAARLTRRLGLSDDQSAKLTGVLQGRQQQLDDVRGNNNLSPQDRHAKVSAIQQDAESQINALLTPTQQTEYANMRQQMMQRRQSQRDGNNGTSGSSGGNSGTPDNGGDSNN